MYPLSPGGPQRPRRALGRWSLQRFLSFSRKLRRGAASAGGGAGPGPHHRCQEKAESAAGPCWEGAGPEQVQSQPLVPLCQHLSGALFLSSLLLIHTLRRCCGGHALPLPRPSNISTQQKAPADMAPSLLCVFPSGGTNILAQT